MQRRLRLLRRGRGGVHEHHGQVAPVQLLRRYRQVGARVLGEHIVCIHMCDIVPPIIQRHLRLLTLTLTLTLTLALTLALTLTTCAS